MTWKEQRARAKEAQAGRTTCLWCGKVMGIYDEDTETCPIRSQIEGELGTQHLPGIPNLRGGGFLP